MRKSHLFVALAAVATMALHTGQIMADFIAPSGLAPGSQYQLVFVTSDTTAATSPDISYYNSFVSAEAAKNPALPATTWHAIASTPTVDAITNAPFYAGVPIYTTNGALVATGMESSYLFSAGVGFDQFGNGLPAEYVWTGTTQYTGLGWPGAQLGNTIGLNPTGIVGANDNPVYTIANTALPLDMYLPLYALSDPITVTPEPATLTLAGTGLLALGGLRIRRRPGCSGLHPKNE
jgi:hypothetical protein